MGSATTRALGETTALLGTAAGVDLGVSGELFAAARALADSRQLSGALADAAASEDSRANAVAAVFAGWHPTTVSLLSSVARQRWSSEDDLVDAVEELAIRAAAVAEPSADVEGELFEVSRIVAANPELELALGSRLGEAGVKGELVRSLLSGRASEATVLIASSVVQRPRERRVRQLLSRALRLVADERGRAVAIVHVAVEPSAEQLGRLTDMLGRRYGTEVALNVVVDPDIVGGLRIEIGDDVIDATVSSRLNDLRQRLAG